MTAYAQYNAVALPVLNFNEVQKAAAAILYPGDIVQMSDGLAGVYAGLEICAIGDIVTYYRTGVYDVLCYATTDTYTAGVAVYYDTNAKVARTTLANGYCIYIGTAYAAKVSGTARVRVELNGAYSILNSTTITFTGGSTANIITVPDALAVALYWKDSGANVIATVCTSNGSEYFQWAPGAVTALKVNTYASGINYVSITPGAAGTGPSVAAETGETNTDLNLKGAGTGSIIVSSGTTPYIKTASGKTNTGYVLVQGKTSAGVKLTCADAMGYTLTLSAAAVATADRTVTFADPGGADTVAYLAKAQTFAAKTFTGVANVGVVITKTVPFIEDATSTTHTGTVPIPAGAMIHNIQVVNTVLWGAASAALDVGDDNDADGYFAAVNCKATDLAVGEVLSTLGGVQTWGGKNGAYLVSATGRMGGVQTGNSGPYYGVANNIIGVMTVGTPAVTTGRTFMVVSYSVGETIAAVAA